jgi:hypothetical protein
MRIKAIKPLGWGWVAWLNSWGSDVSNLSFENSSKSKKHLGLRYLFLHLWFRSPMGLGQTSSKISALWCPPNVFFLFLLFPFTSSIYHDISTINPTTRLYYTRLRLGGTLYDFWAQAALHGVAGPTWERWRRSEMSAGTPAQRSRRFRMLVTRDPRARGKESGI